MAVSKHQRILIVVNSLAKYSTGYWKHIYSFAEQSGVAVAQNVLGDDYKKIVVLQSKNATAAKFLKALASAAKASGIKAVDVFMQLHGSTNTFHFHEGAVSASSLRDQILALKLPKRLRLFYSTCCYGDSQNHKEMLQAGFKTTIGSKRINTTGATEYPSFCSLWQFGNKVADIMPIADNPATRAVQDAAARLLSAHLADTNSKKVIRGDAQLRISS